MPVSGLFSRWSASRRRALVLSSWGYLVGMGEVPLLFFVCFQCTGSELNPVHIRLRLLRSLRVRLVSDEFSG